MADGEVIERSDTALLLTTQRIAYYENFVAPLVLAWSDPTNRPGCSGFTLEVLMSRFGIAVYGVVAYLFFFLTFLYLIGFVEGMVVPKGINDGDPSNIGLALLVNFALLALFGLQHSIMARPWFKARWTKLIPKAAERSTFVLLASLILIFTMWAWQPITVEIWNVEGSLLGNALMGLSMLGWLLVLAATFNIDHFHLFGLKQVVYHLVSRRMPAPEFVVRGLYHLVRHPLMLGFLIAFWVTPVMTVGHLEFTLVMTGYILIALHYEERDLVNEFGTQYKEYQDRTPMLNPVRLPAAPGAAQATESAQQG